MSRAPRAGVAERLGSRFIGPGFPDCFQDLLDGGLEEEQNFLGHDPTVHLDSEFSAFPVHDFHFDSRFLPQGVRHTGSMFAGAASDRAFANGYLFHS